MAEQHEQRRHQHRLRMGGGERSSGEEEENFDSDVEPATQRGKVQRERRAAIRARTQQCARAPDTDPCDGHTWLARVGIAQMAAGAEVGGLYASNYCVVEAICTS